MPTLETLSADTDINTLLAILDRDGALILKDAASADQMAALWQEVKPYVDTTELGGDVFSGHLTTRTGGLVARSAGCRELILNKTIDQLCHEFLHPNCSRHQLHLGQVIRIMPGQTKQAIHRDRWAWGKYLKGVEPQLNTIWAVSEFTKDNGATQVVPTSSTWPDDHRCTDQEIAYAEMQPGSVLVYTGSVFHGGGENVTDKDRIGINLTYTLGWLRQEENQYLSTPPDIAKDLDPKLQDLIGYTMGSYALGYYTPPEPPGEGPGIVGPEYALGRKVSGSGLGDASLYDDLVNS